MARAEPSPTSDSDSLSFLLPQALGPHMQAWPALGAGSKIKSLEHNFYALVVFWALSPGLAMRLPASEFPTNICWVNEWMNEWMSKWMNKWGYDSCEPVSHFLSTCTWLSLFLVSNHLMMNLCFLPVHLSPAIFALPPLDSFALWPCGLVLHPKCCVSASPLSCCPHHPLWTHAQLLRLTQLSLPSTSCGDLSPALASLSQKSYSKYFFRCVVLCTCRLMELYLWSCIFWSAIS